MDASGGSSREETPPSQTPSSGSSPRTLPFNRHYFLWDLPLSRPQAVRGNNGGPFSLFARTPEDYFGLRPAAAPVGGDVEAPTAACLRFDGPHGHGGFCTGTSSRAAPAAAATTTAATHVLYWPSKLEHWTNIPTLYLAEAAAPWSRHPAPNEATVEGSAHTLAFSTCDRSHLPVQEATAQVVLPREAPDGNGGGVPSARRRDKAARLAPAGRGRRRRAR